MISLFGKFMRTNFGDSIKEMALKCDIYRDAEWQANEFAGQLLIPTPYIDLPIEKLLNNFM